VAYRSGEGSARQLVWFDRSGKTLGTMGRPDTNGLIEPLLSPEGRRAAVVRTVQGNIDVWLTDATRMTRLTFDASLDSHPIWSPDAQHLVFDSDRTGRRDLYLVASGSPGSEELLLQSTGNTYPVDWSHDGRFVLYINRDPQTDYDIWVLPMEGDRTPWVWLKTMFDERRAQFSPDGHWIAYMSNESGQYDVYVRPFGGGPPGASRGGQWPVSTAGGVSPRWAANGKELYYLSPDSRVMAVPITATGTTFEPGAPVALFQTRIVGRATASGLGANYDVTNDGRFLVNTVLDDANAPITLLLNWHPERRK
jgi:Tol biopolymer transport system component